jgi:hypothetical protein
LLFDVFVIEILLFFNNNNIEGSNKSLDNSQYRQKSNFLITITKEKRPPCYETGPKYCIFMH